MKFKIIITIFLFIFSLVYLNNAINFIQENDKLMNEIKEKKANYYQKPINAIITKNTMIPGLKGKEINIKKSYQRMKKINNFQESLLVFNEILPTKSINNNYDKVIISGNTNIKQVSIILNITDEYLFNSIDKILKSNNVYANILESSNYSLTNTNFQNSISENYLPFTTYCLTNKIEIEENCLINHKYTLLGYNIPPPFLSNTKSILKNGLILQYEFNKNNYYDLNLIIKYLKNNEYKIVSLDVLVKE